jgi:hypothetical protein
MQNNPRGNGLLLKQRRKWEIGTRLNFVEEISDKHVKMHQC